MSVIVEPDPVAILQTLIRFDTTNPPGNEEIAIGWVKDLLAQEGIPAAILARHPERPNLIARLPGEGNAPPLMLYGHLDVVTTEGQKWEHPPFSGELMDGWVWGRGALDMKSGIAIFLAAFLRAHQENTPLPGDVLLVLLSDEEHGGDFGARYLVERHPGQFQGVRYAIGEFGGFSFEFAGQRFYPIMVAEKQICALRAVIRGSGGHGSLTVSFNPMMRLARFLTDLEKNQPPVHITQPLRLMITRASDELPSPLRTILRSILNPKLTRRTIKQVGELGALLEPLVANTAQPTMVRGGDMINVLPSEIQVGLDGRLLPGFEPQALLDELHQRAGKDIEYFVERFDPGPSEPDLGLFDTLARVLKQADQQGKSIPFLLPAVTDGRFFSRLGIQTYGYIPMKFPPGFAFPRLLHAANERIPAEVLHFGTRTIFRVIQEFGT
jgi:acetylornithine deacetylase/succinyl-diaminopimelate desuccinylase-like protein